MHGFRYITIDTYNSGTQTEGVHSYERVSIQAISNISKYEL